MKVYRTENGKIRFPTSTREIKRIFIDNNVRVGWVVKWGGQYDIALTSRDGEKILLPTGNIRCSDWSVDEWLSFARKAQKEFID